MWGGVGWVGGVLKWVGGGLRCVEVGWGGVGGMGVC